MTFFRLLGPLAPAAGSGKRPALLALLLLSANRVVSTDRLIDDLWGAEPPATAAVAIQNAISQLRRLVGADRIVTHPGGYELRVAAGELDVHAFERGLADAAEATDPAAKLDHLDRALALWRGPALVDFAFEPFARAECERLEELRVTAHEDRIDCELACGRPVVAELKALIAEHPLRERLRAQLMLAFYSAGQQADALAVYHDTRRMLRDELGLEPGPELRRIERAILEQRPLTTAPTALPAPATPIIGRAADAAAVARLLEHSRLVTLTGPGGIGKTRLALEVASAFSATFVELAHVTRSEDVAEAVGDVTADLLVLDNLEQIAGAAAAIGALLSADAGVRILATSRHALLAAGEQEYPVPPLALDDAVALFGQRARGTATGEAVAEICRRLDRLPLAIELAAPWSRLLAPDALLARLESRLDMAARGADDRPERHRTLRATIEWSHRLLDEREQSAFARLGVFAGGFTFEAAEAVADADALAALVDKSFVTVEGERFAMLETIREFALEQLGDDTTARAAHLRWALELAEAAEPELIGRDQERWFDRLEAERANLREALDRAPPAEQLRIAGALWRFWHQRGPLLEGRAYLERALADAAPGPARAKARYGLAVIVYFLGDTAEADRLWTGALEDYREPAGIANTLNNLAMLAQYRGDHDEAERLYREALAGGTERSKAVSLTNLGSLAHDRGDHGQARVFLEEAIARFHAQGDERAAADSVDTLAGAAAAEGDFARAEALCEESLTLFRRLGDVTGVIDVLQRLGSVFERRGEPGRAAGLYEDALARSREAGYTWGIAFALDALARIALDGGDRERAHRLASEALELHRRHEHEPGVSAALETLAR
jgi:predicted ATPase/DNA-binding SARP family transcriptional activator